jgi:hypothetical protein
MIPASGIASKRGPIVAFASRMGLLSWSEGAMMHPTILDPERRYSICGMIKKMTKFVALAERKQ